MFPLHSNPPSEIRYFTISLCPFLLASVKQSSPPVLTSNFLLPNKGNKYLTTWRWPLRQAK